MCATGGSDGCSKQHSERRSGACGNTVPEAESRFTAKPFRSTRRARPGLTGAIAGRSCFCSVASCLRRHRGDACVSA